MEGRGRGRGQAAEAKGAATGEKVEAARAVGEFGRGFGVRV